MAEGRAGNRTGLTCNDFSVDSVSLSFLKYYSHSKTQIIPWYVCFLIEILLCTYLWYLVPHFLKWLEMVNPKMVHNINTILEYSSHVITNINQICLFHILRTDTCSKIR